MPFLPLRTCPKCGSIDVSRSRRRSFLEQRVLPLLLIRPFHCWGCNHRYLGFRYSRKSTEAPVRKKERGNSPTPGSGAGAGAKQPDSISV